MWKRINRKETNKIITECKNEQINKDLPWSEEIIRIANEIKVNLEEAKHCSKEKWKKDIDSKVLAKVKNTIEEEIGMLKRYKYNIRDDITPGKSKRYMCYSQKKAKIWCRMRLDLADPSPRNPYHPSNIWKCKFCEANDQSTEHYVVNCVEITNIFNGLDRKMLFETIRTLEGSDEEFLQATNILVKLYEILIQ